MTPNMAKNKDPGQTIMSPITTDRSGNTGNNNGSIGKNSGTVGNGRTDNSNTRAVAEPAVAEPIVNDAGKKVEIDPQRCVSCFNNNAGTYPCPRCGWYPGHTSDDSIPLIPGTIIGSEDSGGYIVGRVLGQGGFGITYLGWDKTLNTRIAIKEFLPSFCASRKPHCTAVSINPKFQEVFEDGIAKFQEEAQVLAKFQQHPGIINVYRFMRANATGYMVMEYVQGQTLKDYLKAHGGTISWKEAINIMTPVMQALQTVNSAGLMHRDIAPDNIYLSDNKQIKLLDFGAARQAIGEQSRSLTVVLKEGFAPEEQYRTKGKQGPWTDVYGVAATLYCSVVGKIPLPALDRMNQDELQPPSALGVNIPPKIEFAIMKGLSIFSDNRWQSMGDFQRALSNALPTSVNLPITDLIERLADAKYHVQKAAADSLGLMGSEAKSAITALVQTIVDDDASVREAALTALDLIDSEWPTTMETRLAITKLAQITIGISTFNVDKELTFKEVLDSLDPPIKSALSNLLKILQQRNVFLLPKDLKLVALGLAHAAANKDLRSQQTIVGIIQQTNPTETKAIIPTLVKMFKAAADKNLASLRTLAPIPEKPLPPPIPTNKKLVVKPPKSEYPFPIPTWAQSVNRVGVGIILLILINIWVLSNLRGTVKTTEPPPVANNTHEQQPETNEQPTTNNDIDTQSVPPQVLYGNNTEYQQSNGSSPSIVINVHVPQSPESVDSNTEEESTAPFNSVGIDIDNKIKEAQLRALEAQIAQDKEEADRQSARNREEADRQAARDREEAKRQAIRDEAIRVRGAIDEQRRRLKEFQNAVSEVRARQQNMY